MDKIELQNNMIEMISDRISLTENEKNKINTTLEKIIESPIGVPFILGELFDQYIKNLFGFDDEFKLSKSILVKEDKDEYDEVLNKTDFSSFMDVASFEDDDKILLRLNRFDHYKNVLNINIYKEGIVFFYELPDECFTSKCSEEIIENKYIGALEWSLLFASVYSTKKNIFDFIDDLDVFYEEELNKLS